MVHKSELGLRIGIEVCLEQLWMLEDKLAILEMSPGPRWLNQSVEKKATVVHEG
jgi:hypothetical protein